MILMLLQVFYGATISISPEMLRFIVCFVKMSSSGQNSTANTTPSTQSTRGKSDPAWEHISEGRTLDGKKTLTCLYCSKIVKGGGINRMKQHLAGKKGEIGPCKKVPADVRFRMGESLKAISEKKKEGVELYEHQNQYGPSLSQFEGDMDNDDVEVEEIPRQRNKGISIQECGGSGNRSRSGVSMTQKGKGKEQVSDYFAPRTTPGSQPTIKSALANKEAVWRAQMAIARWVYDACIPFNALNSIYFQPMFDAAIAIGPGFKVPSYHDTRVNLLKDSKKEIQLFVESLRNSWADTGCTIMGDGWTDGRHRTLINFLVYSPRGTAFIKSVDASDVVKDAVLLFKLFQEVIEWVGVSNVVHMVTDNGSNYVAAGRIVSETYKSINWSPCAAHCLNLILGDISKLEHVAKLAKKASKITKYVYNHVYVLACLRKGKDWTEIIRPGATRFATTFIALHSLYHHMHDLKALVTSKDFVDSRYAKDRTAKEVIAIILENQFWNDCSIIVKIVEPLMRLLRIVDGDLKPSMGYVYEGMHRARLGIKKMFKNKRILYKPYTKILKERWDRQLRQHIHAAAYWLNPAFQYDQATFCNKPEVMAGLLDVIDSKATCSKSKLLAETRLFRDRLESFGLDLAISNCKSTQPDEWWRLFGHSAPNLKKLAIRILGQTSSSSGCERNWSVFERIHTKKRNRLEHQRLNDLVYVHYNLRLKNMHCYKKKNFDPVDIESIDKTEFWIVEEEEDSPLLDYDELEQMLYEGSSLPRSERQRRRLREDDDEEDVVEIGEDVDLETFGRVVGNDNNDNNEDAWLTRGL